MVSTMAGSAADCQYWSRVIGAEAQFETSYLATTFSFLLFLFILTFY